MEHGMPQLAGGRWVGLRIVWVAVKKAARKIEGKCWPRQCVSQPVPESDSGILIATTCEIFRTVSATPWHWDTPTHSTSCLFLGRWTITIVGQMGLLPLYPFDPPDISQILYNISLINHLPISAVGKCLSFIAFYGSFRFRFESVHFPHCFIGYKYPICIP